MNEIIENIGWLLFDKIFILFLQFIVGVKIANYYGSEVYGLYNYAVIMVSFSSILFELLNTRVIKKFYEKYDFDIIVQNVNIFRNIMAFLIFIVTFLAGKFIVRDSLFYYTLILLCLDNILITSSSGIENFFEYKLDSKSIVIINNFIKLLSYILQYLGIIFRCTIAIIPIVRCIGSIIRIFALNYLYRKKYLFYKRKKLRVNFFLIKGIIKESFYLWISFIGFLIYTQIDKLMLAIMLGQKELGVYSIAVNLTEFLAILIMPLQVSLFPKMLNLYKKDMKEYLDFYLMCNLIITQIYLWGSFLSVIVVKLFFLSVFHQEYFEAVFLYNILMLSILWKANAALQTAHMTIKKITKKSAFKTILGIILNGTLNYILIPGYGMKGAALATTITYFFTLFLIDFFILEYREQAWIQLKSFNPLYLFQILGRIRGRKNNRQREN